MAEPRWKTDLGHRVRALREERGLTRQQLADAAKLSLRFLADVEGGKANPSLGSLHDMASALDVDVIALLHNENGNGRGARKGSASTSRPIALLGLRGAGKSTVGRRVAKALGREFVELDGEIEREAGMSLAELFALHGEAHYRTLEERVLRSLLSRTKPIVLATGGGIVTHEDSWRLLRARTFTVWLKATPQEHWDRVLAQGDERPMANRGPRSRARAELESLYQQRAPLYAAAELVVDTGDLDVERSVNAIAQAAAS